MIDHDKVGPGNGDDLNSKRSFLTAGSFERKISHIDSGLVKQSLQIRFRDTGVGNGGPNLKDSFPVVLGERQFCDSGAGLIRVSTTPISSASRDSFRRRDSSAGAGLFEFWGASGGPPDIPRGIMWLFFPESATVCKHSF